MQLGGGGGGIWEKLEVGHEGVDMIKIHCDLYEILQEETK